MTVTTVVTAVTKLTIVSWVVRSRLVGVIILTRDSTFRARKSRRIPADAGAEASLLCARRRSRGVEPVHRAANATIKCGKRRTRLDTADAPCRAFPADVRDRRITRVSLPSATSRVPVRFDS